MVSKGSELLLQSRRGQHSLGRATTWLLQAAGGAGTSEQKISQPCQVRRPFPCTNYLQWC